MRRSPGYQGAGASSRLDTFEADQIRQQAGGALPLGHRDDGPGRPRLSRWGAKLRARVCDAFGNPP